MKSFLKNSLVVFISLLFALAIGELAVRWLMPPEVREDDKLGFIGIPGKGIDEAGFRNDKALTQADIVAIGDSQTYGNNAETAADAWPQVLGKLRNESVYQMAFGGYGPIQYRALFERALAMQPKHLLVGLYTGNDFLDAYNMACRNANWQDYCPRGFIPEEGNPAARDQRLAAQYGLSVDSLKFRIIKIRLAIRRNFQLYAKLGDATRGLREKLGLAEKKEDINKRIFDYAASSPDMILYDYGQGRTTILSNEYRLAAVDKDNEKTSQGLEIFKRSFSEMAALAKEKEIDFRVIVIPTKEMIFYDYASSSKRDDLERLDKIVGKEKEILKYVRDFFDQEKIAYHEVGTDLVSVLEESEAMYPKVLDGHPNAVGYRLIAESVDKYLKQ